MIKSASNKCGVGILGGTFDPIHFGHLRMAIELYETLGLEKVHLIPCYQPVHRATPIASAHHRLAMVQIAAQGEEALYVDDREIKRQGLSYTIDTLKDLRQEMPKQPLSLLVGIDAFLGFLSWHNALDIFNYAHVVIAHRPNYELPQTGPIANLIQKHLQKDRNATHRKLCGGILLCPITALEIAASDIRSQVNLLQNPRFLLPDGVYDYIKQHQFYNNMG